MPKSSTDRKTTITASTIPTLALDENSILIMRGTGPIGYPGAAEVVNMQPPAYLLKKGHPRIALSRRRAPVGHIRLALHPQRLPGSRGGWRAGTCASPATICASTCRKGTANILIDDEELQKRKDDLKAAGGYKYPASQTPWQEIQRGMVGQLDEGMVLKPAVELPADRPNQGIAARQPLIGPREERKQHGELDQAL